MEYTSGKASRQRPRPRRVKKRRSVKHRITLIVAVLLTIGAATAGFLYPERVQGIAASLARVRNTFSFIVLGQKPHFYTLMLEKNGKDYALTAGDVFEVSYRDEFVIKNAVTDVLFGGGVAVDIAEMGKKNISGKLLKGIDLVDKAVLTGKNGQPGNKPSGYSFRITYQDELIAAVPIRVQITPQDWLRYARSSGIRRCRSNTSSGRSP